MKRFINQLIRLFRSILTYKPREVADPIKPLPVPKPKPISDNRTLLDDWTERALYISQGFEGSDPFANITGNFDGCGLTCGALGWTIKWGNQQRLVKDFIKLYGEDQLKALMPRTGEEYLKVTNMHHEAALKAVDHWSSGAKVLNPYRSELRAFWTDERMINIQIKYAEVDMGDFAMKQAITTQEYFKLSSPKFHHFAYWFDQAVLNGTGKTPLLMEAEDITLTDVWKWMESESGAAITDFKKNLNLWQDSYISLEEMHLLKLAMLRAQRSREEYDTVTMNRRGTLAIGKGYVNAKLWDLSDDLHR